MEKNKLTLLMILGLVAVLALAAMVHAFAVPRAKSFGGVIRTVDFPYARSFVGKAIQGERFITPEATSEPLVEVHPCRDLFGGEYPIDITDIGIKERLERVGYKCIDKAEKSWCCKKPTAWQQL